MDGPEKILYIDDESVVRGAFARGAKAKGFVADLAENLEAALQLVDNHQYGVIAVDYRLASSDGLAVVDALTQKCPLSTYILVSGQVDLKLALAAVNEHGISYLIPKPWDNDELGELLQRSMNDYAERVMARRLESTAVTLSQQLEDQKERLREAAASRPQLVTDALIRAVAARGHETAAHSRRVAAYSVALGHALGVTGDSLVALERGALLHDIGTMSVPDGVFTKTGALTEAEWEQMREHPEAGVRLLDGLENLREAAQIVLQHHELWDGTGYPHKLRGESICLGARIFSVADSLDALTSPRSYHKVMPFPDAIAEICKLAGTRHDPRVVDALKTLPVPHLVASHDDNRDV